MAPQPAAIFFQDDIFTSLIPVEISTTANEDATTPRKEAGAGLPPIPTPRGHATETSSVRPKKQASGQVSKLPNICLLQNPESPSGEKKKTDVAELESQYENIYDLAEPVTKFSKPDKKRRPSKKKTSKQASRPESTRFNPSPPPPHKQPPPAYRPPRREYMADLRGTVQECFRVQRNAHGSAVVRGDVIEKEVEQVEAEQLERAAHRLHVVQEVSALHRERAREMRRRRKKQEHSQTQPAVSDGDDDASPSPLQHPRSGSTSSQKAFDSQSRSPRSHRNDNKSKRRGSNVKKGVEEYAPRVQKSACLIIEHNPNILLSDGAETTETAPSFKKLAKSKSEPAPEIRPNSPSSKKPGRSAVLKRIRNKNERMKMIDKAIKEKTKTKKAMQRALLVRMREFADLPEQDQGLYREGFKAGADENNLITSAETLHECLTHLGLGGTGDRELLEIAQICGEFSQHGDLDLYHFALDLIPCARDKLTELRRQMLFESFCLYDEDASGYLDHEEALQIVEKLCGRDMDSKGMAEIQREFEIIFKQNADDSDQVDFEGFQTLVGKIKEKHQRVRVHRERVIIEEFALSPEDVKMHRDELLPLYESFSSQDSDGSGDLDDKEIIGALLENGLLPREHAERERLQAIVEKMTANGMNFKGFLELIRVVRDECRNNRKLNLKRQFRRYDKDGSGDLSLAEVSLLFIDMDLTPKCQEDQDEMKALLQEVDADGSGELDFDEFQDLVQKITERLRFSQRRRENETAKQLGFNVQQVTELREAFFSLDQDGSGELSIDECRTTLTLLRKNMSAEDLNVLFESIDNDGNGRIDFEEFMHFMKSLSDQRIFEKICNEGRLSFACMV